MQTPNDETTRRRVATGNSSDVKAMF